MKRLVITLITSCLFTCFFNVRAQDIHFSQFYNAPLSLNPALTGVHKSDIRIIDNYRNQWFTLTIPYVSNSLSLDFPVYTRKKHFAGGLNAVYDASGDAQLRISKTYASLAYFLNPHGHIISLAIQPGYIIKNFNSGGATFPDQYNNETGLFDPSLPTSGSYEGSNISYFDLNAGIYWTKSFGQLEPEFGLAVYHLNEPYESFTSSSNKLAHRKVIHGGLKIKTGKLWEMVPKFMYFEHNKASQLVVGSNFNLKNPGISKVNLIYFGTFVRTGYSRNMDAGILTLGAGFKEINIGLSYDINVSGLSDATNYHGAFEVSFIYAKLNKLSKKITIPCERY